MERLKREHAQLQAFLDAVAGPAMLLAPDGTTLTCNQALCRSFGLPRETILGQRVLDFVPPAIRELRQQHFDTVLATRAIRQWEDQRAGRRFLNTMNPVLSDDGEVEAVAVYAIEITRLKALEREREELRRDLDQAQKLELVGRVAGGLAHDLNNVLTVILCNASMGRLPRLGAEELRESLDAIVEVSERAAGLTRKLLTLARKQVVQPQPIHLASALREANRLLDQLLGDRVRLHQAPVPEPLWVLLDPSHLDQIVVNLVTNAGQAMRARGGAATIRVEGVELDTYAGLDLAPGRYAVLEVEDEGEGVAPEDLPRLFEPFFTTRGDHGGTGLGLATVAGLAKRYNGAVTVDSQPGSGSRFRVFLPRYQGPLPSPPQAPASQPEPAADQAILLVEDDATIRKLAAELLEGIGYRVTACPSAEAALEAEPGLQRIDLLLSDLVLRGRHGLDLAAELRRRRPNLACLFMSGYVPDVLDPEGQLTPERFLAKPFTANALIARVVDALARADA